MVLLSIVAQYAILISCTSLVSWRFQRITDEDAFHIVASWCVGVYVAQATLGALGAVIPAILVGALAAYIVNVACGLFVISSRIGLFPVIALAVISLLVFDLATSHAPVAVVLPRWAILASCCAGVVSWSLWWYATRGARGYVLRLGRTSAWAAEYWMKTGSGVSVFEHVALALVWIPIVAIPIGTTGVLSGTIFRVTAAAVVIARVVAARNPFALLGIAITYSVAIVASRFVFLNAVAPIAAEASLFVALLVWLRRRTSRTLWEEQVGR